MDDLKINDNLTIPAKEIGLTAIRSSGPGGQHVNKTATGMQLQFNLHSPSLPEAVSHRLLQRNDQRISKTGVITIRVTQFRSQDQNRTKALDQLKRFLHQGLKRPKRRRPTKPSRSSVEKRLQRKKQRSQIKHNRTRVQE
jgi:ribosome-associated protein